MKKEIRLFLISMLLIIVSALLFFALLLGQTTKTFADSIKTYSVFNDYDEHIEDYIENDSVIVTLNENVKRKYSVNDFKDVGCVEVEDLTQFTSDYLMNKSRRSIIQKSMLVKTESYKQILKLNFSDGNISNVIKAIEVLNKRNDIFVAGPNYVYTVDNMSLLHI